MKIKLGQIYIVEYGYSAQLAKVTRITNDVIEFKFPFVRIFGFVLFWVGPFGLTHASFKSSLRNKEGASSLPEIEI